MGQVREYAYYVKGNKLALVEKEANFDNDPNSRQYGPGVDRGEFKSPLATVADALKIEYSYVKDYFITDTSKSDNTIDVYRSNGGYLEIADLSGDTNFGNLSGYNISDGSYIILSNAGKFNGLHRTITKSNVNGTNDAIKLETRYQGSSSWATFQESIRTFYYVDALVDENFELDVPEYLEEALIYYMKARLAEDAMQPDEREYYMSLFRKRLERHAETRKWGARMISSGPFAIK